MKGVGPHHSAKKLAIRQKDITVGGFVAKS